MQIKIIIKRSVAMWRSMINDSHGQRERSELISLPDLLPPLPPGTELGAEVFPRGRGRDPQSWMPALQLTRRSYPLHHPSFLAEGRSFLERQSDDDPGERTRVIRSLYLIPDEDQSNKLWK